MASIEEYRKWASGMIDGSKFVRTEDANATLRLVLPLADGGTWADDYARAKNAAAADAHVPTPDAHVPAVGAFLAEDLDAQRAAQAGSRPGFVAQRAAAWSARCRRGAPAPPGALLGLPLDVWLAGVLRFV